MGNVSKVQSGQTFEVIQKKVKPVAPENMTLAQTAQYNQATSKQQNEIAKVKTNFKDQYAENGKVELLLEDGDGVAVIQGRNISLAELSQKGQALAEYALELKKFDENGDNHINEDELYTSWGERGTDAAANIGMATVGGASTGAAIGGFGGTAVMPVVGTVAGAGGVGLLGGAIGLVSSALWEGGKTAVYGFTDKYKTASWAR